MPESVEVELICGSCGETLHWFRDGTFISHGEYHECFGETLHNIALVDKDGIRTTREGVEIKVSGES